MGATNGNNIAIPSTNNFFSTSALAGDMVIRSINNLHLLSGTGAAAITIKATNNNVGIANNNPSQILQVGNAGRLRTGNGTTDYSMLGTIDSDGALNTRVVVSGNTRPLYAGNVDYIATTTGSHIFYTTNSTTYPVIWVEQKVIVRRSIGCIIATFAIRDERAPVQVAHGLAEKPSPLLLHRCIPNMVGFVVHSKPKHADASSSLSSQF